MLKNHMIIAIRNMLRYKFYTTLNILGLAVGLSTFFVILLYLYDEWNHDSFHQDSERIFRVTQTNLWSKDVRTNLDALGPAVARVLKKEIPEAEEVCRVHPDGDYLGTYENRTTSELKSFDEKKVLAVDANFFKVFSFPLKEGDPEKVLNRPNLLVISEATAKRYFGNKPALGKNIKLKRGQKEFLFEVSGVVNNKWGKSHIEFDMLASMSSFDEVRQREWLWVWTTFVTYIKVKEKASLQALEAKLRVLPERHAGASIKRLYRQSYKDFVSEYKPWHLYAQPLNEVYLYPSHASNRLGSQGDIRYLYVFMTVGGLIIVLSCINFMNLATARATQRAKEVGIRKVLGSYRKSLISQFLGEAFLFALIATLLALTATEIWVKVFNTIASKNLTLHTLLNPFFLVVIVSLPLFIGLLAGLYPALYMTKFRPTDALKGKMKRGKEGKVLRNGLVVMQFSVSGILIIASLILFQQVQHWQSKKLGFDNSQLVVVPKVERLGKRVNTFQQKLIQHTNISQAGLSDSSPPNVWMQDHLRSAERGAVKIPFNIVSTHGDYLGLLKLQIKQGRVFSRKYSTDTNHVVINQTAVKVLGWKEEEAVGKNLLYGGEGAAFKVIGVVKDFNFSSLQNNIEPLAFFHLGSSVYANPQNFLTFRINNVAQTSQTLSYVEKTWKQLAPALPFEFEFMDQLYRRTMQAERRTSHILMIFTGLALFIASLGLVGLATFSAERRTKEIGVRKVLGASVLQIFTLLSREYVRLILMSLVIAIPVAYYMMDHWLQDFNYRVNIGWQSFAWAAAIAFVVAGMAVVYQSLRAAYINPSRSLRDE